MIKPDYAKALRMANANLYAPKHEIAKSIGLSKNHYFLLCNGTKTPSLKTLEKVASACHVPLSTLIKWGEP